MISHKYKWKGVLDPWGTLPTHASSLLPSIVNMRLGLTFTYGLTHQFLS